jgi:hypothetical protein
MTFRAGAGRRNRWERVAALDSGAGRIGITLTALVFSFGLHGIPGGEPRMTSKGAEKMQNDTIGVDISKHHFDPHRL